MVRILTEKFQNRGMWAEKGTGDNNRCLRQALKLIVMCSKILNHASGQIINN
jgi:hypothetical protein